ncbi:DUF1343 domain-containing protein [Alkalihalobacillus sp. AL-G]|uniref:exo-beta-N-acetylmuramidase NamZ family protein n=1 Tax=Alkalihalobacillus sp. AL-G TaxID=2926399 RepID=UPI00272B0283|nr:DUF1343 domain-containing protein [Alkalihalobacillus sp. AL-G]WLD91936.1 DUF1343 domain-containing protein [Alkalihalobacillus sp. AL-G]
MVKTGLMTLLEKDELKGNRIGLVINHTSVTNDVQLSVDRLKESGFNIVAVFSPEHGFGGHVKEGEHIAHSTDKRTRLPIYSLYGANKNPKKEWLDSIDALVFDIQDIGVRFYTYIYTLANTMQAAGRCGLNYIVLDRPNPITGSRIEGNLLSFAFSSFIGNYRLPIRHGMTVGELALYMNGEFGFNTNLTIIPMEGWSRGMWFDETGLVWVPPSPNAPTLEMASVYPGTCLFEGTNVSEGRGTTKPFEWIGAPWIDGFIWKEELKTYQLKGVILRPISFQPTTSKYNGELCHGLQVHVEDRNTYQPIRTACALIETLYTLYPNDFQWLQIKDTRFMIDLIMGTDSFRNQITSKRPISDWLDVEEKQLDQFLDVRSKYLLY